MEGMPEGRSLAGSASPGVGTEGQGRRGEGTLRAAWHQLSELWAGCVLHGPGTLLSARNVSSPSWSFWVFLASGRCFKSCLPEPWAARSRSCLHDAELSSSSSAPLADGTGAQLVPE